MFFPNLSVDAAVTSCKKSVKFNSPIYYKKLILGRFLSKNPSARFFQKKIISPKFCSVLNLHTAVTSCKKSETFHALKNLISGPYLAHFSPKTSKSFFPKKTFPPILSLYAAKKSFRSILRSYASATWRNLILA